jgi:hypothetical protein
MIKSVEQLVEWLLGENLPQFHLTTTNPIRLEPSFNPHRRGGKPATNRLRHGTTYVSKVVTFYKFSETDYKNLV